MIVSMPQFCVVTDALWTLSCCFAPTNHEYLLTKVYIFSSMEKILGRYEQYSYAEKAIASSDLESQVRKLIADSCII